MGLAIGSRERTGVKDLRWRAETRHESESIIVPASLSKSVIDRYMPLTLMKFIDTTCFIERVREAAIKEPGAESSRAKIKMCMTSPQFHFSPMYLYAPYPPYEYRYMNNPCLPLGGLIFQYPCDSEGKKGANSEIKHGLISA